MKTRFWKEKVQERHSKQLFVEEYLGRFPRLCYYALWQNFNSLCFVCSMSWPNVRVINSTVKSQQIQKCGRMCLIPLHVFSRFSCSAVLWLISLNDFYFIDANVNIIQGFLSGPRWGSNQERHSHDNAIKVAIFRSSK